MTGVRTGERGGIFDFSYYLCLLLLNGGVNLLGGVRALFL